MGCGCRGKNAARQTSTVSSAVVDAMQYEVYRNGKSTGRKFTTITSAQAYARSVGGDVVKVGS